MSASDWPVTEQETRLQELFLQLEKLLRKAEKAKNPDKLHGFLKDTTNKLKECKALLKDFEREARTDGMPAQLLAQRKKVLADQLNVLINRKKEVGQSATKDELMAGAVVQQEENLEQMSVQQLIQKGRRDMADTDATLNRAERLVEDTLQTGTQTAGALHDQTNQLNKIVDDLADIEFNVKKASKVIRDITRGLLTDKCIGFLLFACICGVIAIIILKVVNPRKSNISDGINTIANTTAGQTVQQAIQNAQQSASNAVNSLPGSTSPPPAGRRRLLDSLLSFSLSSTSGPNLDGMRTSALLQQRRQRRQLRGASVGAGGDSLSALAAAGGLLALPEAEREADGRRLHLEEGLEAHGRQGRRLLLALGDDEVEEAERGMRRGQRVAEGGLDEAVAGQRRGLMAGRDSGRVVGARKLLMATEPRAAAWRGRGDWEGAAGLRRRAAAA